MTTADSSWLNFWEVFATIGFVLVIIGVVIEGVEHLRKFSKKEHARKLQIEKIGWFVLVAGLAMEFLGEHMAKRIADRENSRLAGEAAEARKSAGQASERASLAELKVGQLRKENLVLRSNVVALELKLQTRRITPEQAEIFAEYLRNHPKNPVKVFVGATSRETEDYARQIRAMLDKAGYGTGRNNDITRCEAHLPSSIGDPAKDSSIHFMFFGTPLESIDWPGFKITLDAAGYSKVTQISNGVSGVPAIILQAFLEIGITPAVAAGTNCFIMKSGDWGIMIPQKV